MMLNIEHLSVVFRDRGEPFTAVKDFGLQMDHGEIVGIVGESGSGKSMTAHAIMGLIQRSSVAISGRAMFEGTDLFSLSKEQMREYQGKELSIIFQEPMTSLNPTMKIGEQIAEMLRLHRGMSAEAAWNRAVELLELVGIANARARAEDYPHRFSGGMRQRVMIAIAASCEPQLIVADEFTTALDVTTQAQVLEVLRQMTARTGTSIAIVTHNLGLIARYAHRINVMYAGRIIESGTTRQLFGNPLHPYTRGLLAAVPRLDMGKGEKRLTPIPGLPPDLAHLPDHCAFYDRCPVAVNECRRSGIPTLKECSDGHCAACLRVGRD